MKINSLKKIIVALPKNALILDAGCGKGVIYRYIHRIRKDIRIFAIDISGAAKPGKFVRFRRGSVEDMPYSTNFFDAIVCFHVIEHLDNPEKAISEFRRTLKRNGTLLIETPHWVSAITPVGYNFYSDKTHKKPFSKKSLSALLKGFEINEMRFDSPIYFYLGRKSDKLDTLRNILDKLGIYRTVVWAQAAKN